MMWDADISILDRCTERRLKELLRLASRAENVTHNWLLEIGDAEHLESLLSDIGGEAGTPGATLLRTVCSAATTLESLGAIKSQAKRLTMEAEGPAEKAAATLLYHLSVAAALGRYGRNISSKDPKERLTLYQDLAAKLSDSEWVSVFEKAVVAIKSAH